MTEERPARIVRFGAGSLAALADVCAEAGITRPLLVASRRGAASAGGLPVVGVYDGVRPHVPIDTVREVAAVARERRADGLVAFGGGSAIDTCKAAVAELADSVEPLPRVVAIPTTYAGAEWTSGFGVLLEPGRKGGGRDERARPIAAIYDPGLSLDLPLDATVGTAMNAICLPVALRFNAEAVPGAVARFGKALGTDDPVARVEELARLGGFGRLRDVGVPEEELDLVAEAVVARPGAQANPRAASPAEVTDLLREVW